jgi:hypothetical protein
MKWGWLCFAAGGRSVSFNLRQEKLCKGVEMSFWWRCRWVDGELLQFSANGYITKGAEMGFVWVVPNERRYLILLSRIELDDFM